MQGQADLFLMIMQSGNRKRNVMCASSNFNLLCDKLNYLGLGCVLFVYIMYANTSHNVCGGNEVKPFQPGASIDAPPPSLFPSVSLLFLSLPSSLFKKHRRTMAQSRCFTIQQYFLPPSVSLNALKLI